MRRSVAREWESGCIEKIFKFKAERGKRKMPRYVMDALQVKSRVDFKDANVRLRDW